MSELLLSSLEIQNFRAFRELRIEKLGRINLIVGKNSVGKTSLLEALLLYAHQGDIAIIRNVLSARDEQEHVNRRTNKDNSINTPLSHLFFGRKASISKDSIIIRSNEKPSDFLHLNIDHVDNDYEDQISLIVRSENDIETYHDIDLYPDLIDDYITTDVRFANIFIPSGGLEISVISHFWDNITLTDLEDEIVSALQIIEPNIERVSIIGSSQHINQRHPIVKMKAINHPIPLRSLGDGMLRAFGIALALVNVRDGMLLVDEFESGLHYSVQLDLWRLIFQTARRLNIQVFATTHSWDCVEAFQKAAEEDQGEEAMLIRLERHNDDIRAVLFDERRLRIATREQIEVR